MSLNKHILTSYIKENFIQFFIYIFVILLAVVSVNKLYIVFKDSIFTPFTVDEIVKLTLFKTLTDLPLLTSITLFFAVNLNLNSYYKSSEYFIFQNTGFGKIDFFNSLVPIILPITLFSFFLSLFVSPIIEKKINEERENVIQNIERFKITPKVFNFFNNDELVIYSDSISSYEDRENYNNIFIFSKSKSDNVITIAERAIKTKKENLFFLELINGKKYSLDSDFEIFNISSFDILELNLSSKNKHSENPSSEIDAMSTIDLLYSNSSSGLSEVFWRIVLPLSSIFLAIISLIFSNISLRQNSFKNHFLFFSMLIVYFLFIITIRTSIENESIDFISGLTLSVIMPFFFIFIYIYKYHSQKRLLKNL